MGFNLKDRSLLDIAELTPQEIRSLLDLAHALKAEKHRGVTERRLVGKNICLIFEKTSTRTRCAFEVAANDLGMGVTYWTRRVPDRAQGIDQGHGTRAGAHVRRNRVPRDRADRRGRAGAVRGCPVYNGLTDESHPTQILAI
jgi:ornithine carbamoyltransferase